MNHALLGQSGQKQAKSPQEMNGAQLAYMGDAVYELYVRYHLLAQGISRPARLQRQAATYVSAKGQVRALERIEAHLTPEERSIIKRGRNAKTGQIPKHTSVNQYRLSTGFEALIGYLYLSGRQARLNELIDLILTDANIMKEKEA
jgi:ribonuclease-3 family protein